MKNSTLAYKIKEVMISRVSRTDHITSECHICPKEIYKEITGRELCSGNCAMEANKMLDILGMDYPPRAIISSAVDCSSFCNWFLEQQITNFRIIKI